jgi:hypothetical protein
MLQDNDWDTRTAAAQTIGFLGAKDPSLLSTCARIGVYIIIRSIYIYIYSMHARILFLHS